MSVCNIFVGGSQILCVTDTMVYRGAEPAALCTKKCFPSHNSQFAIGLRGTVAFCERILEEFLQYRDFDNVECGAQEFCKSLPEDIFYQSEGEISLLGWSNSRDGLCAIRMDIKSPQAPISIQELGAGHHLAPSIPGARLPKQGTDDLMIKIALAQHGAADKFKLPMCIGGVMHITTITKQGACQRVAGVYPEYSNHAEKFNCPNLALYGTVEAMISGVSL